jgi:hypothetical protein
MNSSFGNSGKETTFFTLPTRPPRANIFFRLNTGAFQDSNCVPFRYILRLLFIGKTLA